LYDWTTSTREGGSAFDMLLHAGFKIAFDEPPAWP
jgi:hypothetical protein